MRTLLALFALLMLAPASAQELLKQEHHANGRLKSTLYREGVTVHFITYFESGRVKEMGAFRDGRRDGLWQQFAANGTLLTRAEFDRGVRTGTWELRDPFNGNTGRLRFSDGRLVDGAQYDPNGQLLAARTY
ncbi:MAG TPA: hypothetical protein PLH93_04900 [Flavobacteriales bacterium]|nr:hypothetical protein [Flavobacteriales bacterium]